MENERLIHILETHFDPVWGTPYWLEQRGRLDFSPLSDIKSLDDLARFPGVPRTALASRPVTDFIPRRFHDRLAAFVTCETGGATGMPARTAFREDEFHAAFIEPFVQAVELVHFPKGRPWLFVGPSGPHPIGKAARSCARATGSMDPFMVDFDPRWFRKMPRESMFRERYFEHILEQAMAILRSQDIGVLFSTPPVIQALGERMEPSMRNAVEGLHLGGMPADATFWKLLTTEWFPRAVPLSGYGNSLAGMCPQLAVKTGDLPEYFPHGERLILRINAARQEDRGQVVFTRLDESCFLPNMAERDEAGVSAPPAHARAAGFSGMGISNPCPPPGTPAETQEGLY